MANADHLILGIGVGAILITITVGAILHQPPPQTGIRLETSKESYRLGERVDVRLENHGPLTLCTIHVWPWSVMRQVGDDWHRVALIWVAEMTGDIRPGETLRWGWVAESDPHWESNPELAEVLPGEYRFGFSGWLCGEMAPELTEYVAFYAYFELVG